MTPKTFKALKKHPKVASISYEPSNSSKQINPDTGAEFEVGSIYWVYLSVGWYHDDEGKHVITASTLAQVKEQMGEVLACNCDQCLLLKRSG